MEIRAAKIQVRNRQSRGGSRGDLCDRSSKIAETNQPAKSPKDPPPLG